MSITFTDAEQQFADSPRGRAHVARAKNQHETSEAYRGASARPFTDAMAADAVRDGATSEARASLAARVFEAQLPAARAAHDTAYAMSKERMSNAWKGK